MFAEARAQVTPPSNDENAGPDCPGSWSDGGEL
jgi:hypothetical protein